MKEIIEYFGVNNQQRKLAEEVFELQEAITKFENGVGDIKDIVEELVDVLILIEQFRNYYEIEMDELPSAMEFKIKRTIQRIESGFYANKK